MFSIYEFISERFGLDISETEFWALVGIFVTIIFSCIGIRIAKKESGGSDREPFPHTKSTRNEDGPVERPKSNIGEAFGIKGNSIYKVICGNKTNLPNWLTVF